MEHIKEAARCAETYATDIDFLDTELRQKCEEFIPLPQDIPSEHIKAAYLLLKQQVH